MSTYASMIADIKSAIETLAEKIVTDGGRSTVRYMIRGREYETNNPAESIEQLSKSLKTLEDLEASSSTSRTLFKVAKIGSIG